MIDERLIELIHAELDGELGADGRRELDAGLADSEEARAYRDGMQDLDAFLTRVPAAEPPARLHERIMETLVLPAPARRRMFAWRVPALVRYGLAVAAGLLLSVSLFRGPPGPATPVGVENMSGTLMPAAQRRQVLDEFAFEQQGLSGSATLVRQGGALVLETSWFSEQPAEMTIDAHEIGWRIDGIDQAGTRLDRVEVKDGSVRVTAQGHQQFAVHLGAGAKEPLAAQGAIRLSWVYAGAIRQTGQLRPE